MVDVYSYTDTTLQGGQDNLFLLGSLKINGTGNNLNNVITGNSVSNQLNGGIGNDTINGYSGNDTIDGGADDDNLIGSLGNDSIIGGTGNDVLEGSSGNDTLTGGAGFDAFLFTSPFDRPDPTKGIIDTITDFNVAEDTIFINRSGFGNGLVLGTLDVSQFVPGASAVDANDRFIYDAGALFFDPDGNGLTAQIQIATLTGAPAITSANIVVIGTGNNALTGDNGANSLTGDSANNNIYGVAGDDILTGNDGNDTLIGGTGNDNLIGGTGNDYLIGGADNDTLIGGAGVDTLTGGLNNDFFQFNASNEGIDTITDFNVVADTIRVSASGFGGGLVAGTLPVASFFLGSVANDASDRFIYDSSTGALRFDIDGNGSTAAVQIATLNAGLAMTNADIVVF